MARLCRLPESFLQGFGLGLFEISPLLSGIPNKGSIKRLRVDRILRKRFSVCAPTPSAFVRFCSPNETRKKNVIF